jgi:membrane protease YdiL (CAAX protease family)
MKPIRNLVRRRPVGTFLVFAIGLTWAMELVSLFNGWDLTPAKLAELIVLLGAAVAVTGWTRGRAGLRQLFAAAFRWRLGVGRYLFLLLSMPLLTMAVGAATGTLRDPAGGWLPLIGGYLFLTLVFGALLANIWEETAWSGIVQSRLMSRHGLLVGSMLTAVPFALIHLPLAFENHGLRGTSVTDVAITWAVLIGAAPFMRYLLGTVLLDTGGSILAVGILHASFNASGAMSTVPGGWQNAIALVPLTMGVVAYRRFRGRSMVGRPVGAVPATVAVAA